MPTSPAKPCRKPGCPNLITDTYLGLCPQHKREYQREHDRDRGSAAARGYNARWRRRSKLFLKRYPLCVECLKKSKRRAATIVDHIKPHRGDSVLFWDESNWQSLCKPHHDRKTAMEKLNNIQEGKGHLKSTTLAAETERGSQTQDFAD